ncbi:FkbM family methyltransferase [Flavobacterium sp. N2038]|uniref:FkbM family methyltransferase n=1 Tax=Flavobacterium sp. N2038 TaxID=2986829 RepID=UPI0022250484|nr:FkbM family methyltransferase [Flavobacterium sp. N2038]
MRIAKIFKNLKRLNFINLTRLIIYKLKKKINSKTTQAEKYLSLYYNYLVRFNGVLIEETSKYYITEFKDKFSARVKLRKTPSSDFDVFYQVVVSNEYLPVVTSYRTNFKLPLNYTPNIIDAGSNIGLTSLFFINQFQSAKIVAVEPDTDNFQVLDYNLQEKDNFEFIKINGAIWSSNTKIKVINDFRDRSDWSFRVEESNDSDAMQSYTINDLMSKNNFDYIDILKIDIEGAEKQIFTSFESDLDFLNKTKCIAIEIHDELECRDEINTILDKYGFSIIHEGELTIGINKNLRDTTA